MRSGGLPSQARLPQAKDRRRPKVKRNNEAGRTFAKKLTRRELFKGAALAGMSLTAAALVGCADGATPTQAPPTTASPLVPATETRTELPTPPKAGPLSLEAAIAKRRSVRDYAPHEPSAEEIAQLLWAAQGITDARTGFRAAPSAGALYPLEVYAVLRQGVYRYLPEGHALVKVREGDWRQALYVAGLAQSPILEASLVIVVAAVYERTRVKYGDRAERYVMLEAGHAAQNILLQAVALGLGGVPIGAFHDEAVQQALGCPADHRPLYIIPIGVPR